MILINTEIYMYTVLLSLCRETETFESVAEDDQLPQVVDELHDVHVCPGSPIAKLQLKVKGEFTRQYTNTWALDVRRYQPLIHFQCLNNKLYASLCGSEASFFYV